MTMAPQQYDANDFLMGGGIPSAKFPNQAFGTTWTGTICAQPEVVQQTDADDGKPLFFDDGKPRMQLVVTVQTDVRDPEVDDDDGKRKFYIKAKMQDAVKQAVKQSGAKGLAVGGILTITYVADGEKKKFSPPKLYTAVYQPPAAAAANAFLNGGQQPQAAPPQQYAAPQYAAPAQGFVPPSQGATPQWAQPAPVPASIPAALPVTYPADESAVWTPPPGMAPEQAAALAALQPSQRAALGY